LFIAAPGFGRAGAVAAAPVGLIDLYPTLTELCGVTPPQNLQGQSLVPMLRDPSLPGRGWALSQVTRGGGFNRVPITRDSNDYGSGFFGYTLRTPRWRFTEWAEGSKGRELYDHDHDPKELTNLVEQAAHADTVAGLSATLRAAVRDSFPASGSLPPLREGSWPPNLTDP
jgi:iduronate 2-sulfatase